MRLHLFEHCSICFRVPMAAALKLSLDDIRVLPLLPPPSSKGCVSRRRFATILNRRWIGSDTNHCQGSEENSHEAPARPRRSR